MKRIARESILCRHVPRDRRLKRTFNEVFKEKNMYGKKVMGIVRTTYVIDPKGKIAAIYPKVKVDGHVDAILASL